MARPPGIEYPGVLYPLVSSENARKAIHPDDHDRQNYLNIRSEVVKRDSWYGIHYAMVSKAVRKAGQVIFYL